MQLIIEIPEDVYREIMDGSDIEIYYGEIIVVKDSWASNIMRNGTPLPEHYGDLIDRTELLKQYGLENATKYGNKNAEQQKHSYSTMMMYEIADMIENAETIIPATKEECALTDCRCNDNGKCLDGVAYKETCYDCYQTATKEEKNYVEIPACNGYTFRVPEQTTTKEDTFTVHTDVSQTWKHLPKEGDER